MTGTAAYLAPEIIEGSPFTVKADVCTRNGTLVMAKA